MDRADEGEMLPDLFAIRPAMVLRLTLEGRVLSANLQTQEFTGYSESELLGRNIWGILFPGRLFRQIPGFISQTIPWGAEREIPLTLRTKEGTQVPLLWTRSMRESAEGQEMLCLAVAPRGPVPGPAPGPAQGSVSEIALRTEPLLESRETILHQVNQTLARLESLSKALAPEPPPEPTPGTSLELPALESTSTQILWLMARIQQIQGQLP